MRATTTIPAIHPHRRVLLKGLLGLGSLGSASAAALLAGCSKPAPKAAALPAGATVLALGDSLTQGVGAPAQAAYPVLLAQATGWNVINAGISGNTTAQALQRLPELLQRHQPALVIVSIGGNDFLRRQSESAAEQNIRQICALCQQAGAQVVLVAVPGVSALAAAGLLSDHAMYGRIAKDLQLPLLEKSWSRILGDDKLKSDQIHSNAQGYAQFAADLQQALRQWGFWQ